MTESRLGLSGRVAAAFQSNPLTPVLALLALLLGLVAVLVTPREEEPQIDVTMANVFVPFPGASADEVERMVATPLEQKLDEIAGVKHVYSVSRPGMAVLTVEFTVGVPRQTAIVRLYNQVYANQDWVPANAGIGPVLVKPKGIDDVPVMSVTLWTDDPHRSAADLAEVAHTLETELKRIPGTRDIYTIGAPDRVVAVTLDPAKLAAYDLTVPDLAHALQAANVVRQAGERVGDDRAVPVTAGRFLASADDVADLVIALKDGKPVRLRDVATVHAGADIASSYVWFDTPPGRSGPASGTAPAMTIAIAKKSGSNAADITAAVTRRLTQLQGEIVPRGVHVTVTRDYGRTATDKALKLIEKLVFATASVVLLVLFTLGRREAIVVGAAVVLTLALTLFASTAMGFTLNRVSLFALIFSIGILVDDAIVIVENVHRHLQRGGAGLREAIPVAVDEVGGPTILATFTVIAALLPMAFVTGLMGPYMRPIPINASAGMLLSLLVAMVATPWLSLKLLRRHGPGTTHPDNLASAPSDPATDAARPEPAAPTAAAQPAPTGLHRFFERMLRPFLDQARGGRRRLGLFAAMIALVLLAASLVGLGAVVMKMLPFDNKSEFQVVLDMPEGSTLEDTNAVLGELARAVERVPEVTDIEGYAGTSAPINFNGLVRQYFLRNGSNVGDLQVNLLDKHLRKRQSHAIVLAVRPVLAAIGQRHGASVKLVEVPPGPPVLAPLVAEIYGPDPARSRTIALALAQRFRNTKDVVDIDTSVEADSPRETLVVDRDRASALGVPASAIVDTLAAGMQGLDMTYVHDGAAKYPRPIRLRLPVSERATLDRLLALRVRGAAGQLVPLSELVHVQRARWDDAIWHKDLLPVAYVTGDTAGTHDSPLYGMFDLVHQIAHARIDGVTLAQSFIAPPTDTSAFAVKWDGEWQITYETFRDMGIAYAAGMVLIYLLLVAQFHSYLVPLVIMAPIPLTAIGVMPGHALLGAQFTATSMIGMIALAGIIVRNSILLVDFIRHAVDDGQALEHAVVEACAVRAKPIALTGVAAMLGALFILDDPIFNGLAISLIFGILVSTILTLLVIPLLYYALRHRQIRTSTPAPEAT